MMMTREIMETLIGEKISDAPVSDETLRKIEELRAAGRKILDDIRAQNELRFPWLKENDPFNDGERKRSKSRCKRVTPKPARPL
jgi:hypothetical protein